MFPATNIEYPKCNLVCHWGGEMVEEPGGINYNGGEVRVLLANNKMSFSEVLKNIYELMGIDQSSVDLKLKMRFPTAGSYTAVPLHDDNSLSAMWSRVSQLSKFFMELYIEQVPVAKASTTTAPPVLNCVDVHNASVNVKKEVTIGASPYAHSPMSDAKKFQDELEKTGSKIKQHEENVKFLKAHKTKLDDVILDLQVSVDKSLSSSSSKAEDQYEEEIVQQILKHGNSAAGIFYQLKTNHGSQLSNLALYQGVIGVVATLAKVDDETLSRLFSEYLGLETMLSLVCKTYEGIRALEIYNDEGLVNKSSGIHGLGASIGGALKGRFRAICLDNLIPYPGEILSDDPQRRLEIPKPRLSNGDIPAGFMGFAVNMVHLDMANLVFVTATGSGLRETLFYNLFSRLQVYKTRSQMLLALPCISHGAVSLDGGMIKSRGVLSLGNRKDVDVWFPKRSTVSALHNNYNELENQMKRKEWERERIVEDLRREQSLLDHEKFNFSLKKQDFLKHLADWPSSDVAQQQKTATQS